MRYLIQILLSFFVHKETPILLLSKRSDFQSENCDTKSQFSVRTVQGFAQLRQRLKGDSLAYAMATLPLVSPIQNIKPDDIVKAYHHEQSYYATADNNDQVYVLGWQDYDYQHITPETWQIGTFEIIEANGDIVNVEANRPKTWYKENNVNALGDKAHFFMPEIGINGDATLLSVRPTTINTANLALNETGQVDRPVITTFKRNAPKVFDYYFSDGAVIGATPEHPFFSVDRNDYIAVGELQLGEQVMAAGEKVVKFIAGKQRDNGDQTVSDEGRKSSDKKSLNSAGTATNWIAATTNAKQVDNATTVYNFEVWREHNYYVGSKESGEFLLVHNSYFLDKKALAKFLGVTEDYLHKTLKPRMIKDWKHLFPNNFGGNPDIVISAAGKLLFKSRLNGNIIDTDFDISNYID